MFDSIAFDGGFFVSWKVHGRYWANTDKSSFHKYCLDYENLKTTNDLEKLPQMCRNMSTRESLRCPKNSRRLIKFHDFYRLSRPILNAITFQGFLVWWPPCITLKSQFIECLSTLCVRIAPSCSVHQLTPNQKDPDWQSSSPWLWFFNQHNVKHSVNLKYTTRIRKKQNKSRGLSITVTVQRSA